MKKVVFFVLLMITGLVALQAHTDSTVVITSAMLEVTVDAYFPAVKQYHYLNGDATMKGDFSGDRTLMINGKIYTPKVHSEVAENSIVYYLALDDLDLSMTVKIMVQDNVVDVQWVAIEERGEFRVSSLTMPQQQWLTVTSADKGAAFAGARMFTAVKGHDGDMFQRITRKTPVDTSGVGCLYGILYHEALAGALWTNAVEEITDKYRIIKQVLKAHHGLNASLRSGSWLWRAKGMKKSDDMPHMKIVVTAQNNDDGVVDWQDGAIAYRKILNNPVGADKIPGLVVFRIPMNFASQATNPFTKTLDETKRIYLNTDGLGQFVILKGYGGEGHDSNHPDYGYIGNRQGGAREMNILCNAASHYHAMMGVHINGTESYPEAQAFNENLVYKDKKGWDWLDGSFYINKRYDAVSGNRLRRLQSLKQQVPALDFIYLDVWYARGSWDSRKIAREINAQGWMLATEFPQDHEYDAVWNHWAVDYQYGGEKIKGLNSKIARFIRNHQKDTWVAKHPLLGGAEMVDYEGWQGRVNYDSCIDVTFRVNLPTKYLQHHPVLRWDDEVIMLEDKVMVRMNREGKRQIYQAGHLVVDNDRYLIPWRDEEIDKLYHWNGTGNRSSWSLTDRWRDEDTLFLYQLTDQGRQFAGHLVVNDGTVVIDALPATPYVVYRALQSATVVEWSEGMLVKNSGFNSGNLDYWQVQGNGVAVERNKRGQYELVMRGREELSVRQDIQGLAKHRYCAEVYVSTSRGRRATMEVKTAAGVMACFTNSSLWKNYIAADSKQGTTMQRMTLFFDVADYHEDVEISLHAAPGDTPLFFDDVRIIAIDGHEVNDTVCFFEDFEHVPAGLYPFVKGSAGGINDPRVHLAQKHAPYTQRGWNEKKLDDVLDGHWSLKMHEEAQGLIIQTLPQNVRFEPGVEYRVSFDYQTSSGDYSLVLGDDTTMVYQTRINPQFTTRRYEITFTASSSGNTWVGFVKRGEACNDFILDNFRVDRVADEASVDE